MQLLNWHFLIECLADLKLSEIFYVQWKCSKS